MTVNAQNVTVNQLPSSAKGATGGYVNNNKITPGYASGGYVKGPGSGTSDSIPARLSAGEYVIKASSVKKYGKDTLDQLNFGSGGMIPGYPMGGLIPYKNGGLAKLFKSVGKLSGSAAIWTGMENLERFLNLKFGANKNSSGSSKWKSALGRAGFNTAQGAATGLPFGGFGGALAGTGAGLVEGLIGLARDGSQYGVKGGQYSTGIDFNANRELGKITPGNIAKEMGINALMSTAFAGLIPVAKGAGRLANKVPFINKLASKASDKFSNLMGNLTGKSGAVENIRNTPARLNIPKELANKKLQDMSNREYKSLVEDFIYRRSKDLEISAKDELLPIYDILGQGNKVSFIPPGQSDMSYLLNEAGIEAITTDPVGLLTAALKKNPSSKKLQKMLDNFKSKNIGAEEIKLIDNISAAVSINKSGKFSRNEQADGFPLLFASLTGNPLANRIINFKRRAFLDAANTNMQNRRNQNVKSAGTYLGDAPNDVVAIHSTKHQIVKDKDGNILLYPGGNMPGYEASRASQHFTLEAPVKSHLFGQWSELEQKIVSPFNSMINDNGVPNAINATDTWWLRNPGEALKISNYSIVTPFNDATSYRNELLRRKLIGPNDPVPPLINDINSKDVLYMIDPLNPNLADNALQMAKKNVGIDTPSQQMEQWSLSSSQRDKEISKLISKYGADGGIHSGSISQILERANPQDYNRFFNPKDLATLRMISSRGSFNTKFKKPIRYMSTGVKDGGYIKGYGMGGPTDDSILARISNGEYVMSANAVKKMGVGFMDRLNSGSINLPGYSMGGYAKFGSGGYAMKYADGGPVDSSSNSVIYNVSMNINNPGASADEIWSVFESRMNQEKRRMGKNKKVVY
jgi:hypothetical protein